MRRKPWLVAAFIGGTLLVSGVASAKGSTLRFTQERYAPGDRAVAHALVETGPKSNETENGPYWVYLVRGRQPLWYGHLPSDSIRVGRLHIGRLVSPDTYRVRVAFAVPHISKDRYQIWVCRAKCGANKGFGELVNGQIVVGNRSPLAGTGADTRIPLLTAVLLSALGLCVATLSRRRNRASGTAATSP